MSSWLKKSYNELLLYHTSEIPYFVTDGYVIICDTNAFTEDKNEMDNHIGFYLKKSLAKRLSANYWKTTTFPLKISKNKIVYLVNNGNKPESDSSKIKIAMLKSSYTKKLGSEDIYNIIDNYDKSFLFSKQLISDDSVRVASNIVNDHIIYGSWHSLILNILDKVCLSQNRESNWIRDIPDVSLDVYGIKNASDLDALKSAINDFDLSDKIDLRLC